MSKKLYGSIINRLEEGRTVSEIKVDMPITMYYWSDRTCYYVTDVVSQKEIKVKEYEICADHDKAGGQGHQNWKYFKTRKEHNEYLNKYFPDHNYDLNPEEPEPETWVYRYNKWKHKVTYTIEDWKEALGRVRNADWKEGYVPTEEDMINSARWHYFRGLNDEEFEKVLSGKEVVKYYDLSGKISFGVRDYYHDWEF